ncbi:MAG: hypothetical protein RLZZ46_1190 [Bacteroidota bacterium]|jgi:hypothetical protein
MKVSKALLILFLLKVGLSFGSEFLKPTKKVIIDIGEPSDICQGGQKDSYYVVSDNGSIYKWNNKNQAQKLKVSLWDAEGVCLTGKYLCVMEETPRRIVLLDTSDFTQHNSFHLVHTGGRNQSFESIAVNFRNEYLTCIEKNPAEFRLLDSDFTEKKRFSIDNIKEVSGITFHADCWWILSDEGSCVYVLNSDFKIMRHLRFDVMNAEGITFNEFGEMMILSDDLHSIYYFKIP